MKNLLLACIPAVLVAACSGAGTDGQESTVARLESAPIASGSGGGGADASVPCPKTEPAVGSSCYSAVDDATCTYGKCTDPEGAIELKCESDIWTVVGGSVCRSADAGKPPACTSGGFGNANGVCSSDYSFFESATADCKASKLVLSSFSLDEKCGAGSSNSGTYSCCATAKEGSGGGFGNANNECSSDVSMFTSAEEGCLSSKQQIIGFVPNEYCGAGSSSAATFTCGS
jgi:hypothetical protein